jgi:hypothetical protein
MMGVISLPGSRWSSLSPGCWLGAPRRIANQQPGDRLLHLERR